MKLHTIILFCFIALMACKKEPKLTDKITTPVDSTDTTDTPDSVKVTLKDTTIRAKGLPDTIFLKHIDSVVIPITIMRDSGSIQNVTLSTSLSSLRERMGVSIIGDNGTLPFTSGLQITNYLGNYATHKAFSSKPFYVILTITTNSGAKYNDTAYIDFKDEKTYLERFYETYLNDTLLVTTNKIGVSMNWQPRMGYNTTDGLNFSNLMLYIDAPDIIYSIDNGVDKNGIKVENILLDNESIAMQFYGSDKGITATGIHPTFNFHLDNITDYPKLYFMADGNPDYYMLTYTVSGRFTQMGPSQDMHFIVRGKYKFK